MVVNGLVEKPNVLKYRVRVVEKHVMSSSYGHSVSVKGSGVASDQL